MILSIDTSTSVCSIALHDKEKQLLLYNTELTIDRAHSSALTQLIESCWEITQTDAHQLSAVAVASGPGSYTGLRIGAAVAKGICYGAKKPLIAIPTLLCMAQKALQYAKVKSTDTLLCPMIDARRMEVYTAIFNQNLKEVEKTQAKVIDETAFGETLQKYPVLFFGDGADKCKETIRHENAFFLEEVHPNAKEVGELAIQKFNKNEFEDTAYFEPFYLKNFEAKKPAKDKLKM